MYLCEQKDYFRQLSNIYLEPIQYSHGIIFYISISQICLPHDNTEGQMTEVEGVGRRKFDDLRNRRRYWELKEEAEDRKRCKRQSNVRKTIDLLISSILNIIIPT